VSTMRSSFCLLTLRGLHGRSRRTFLDWRKRVRPQTWGTRS